MYLILIKENDKEVVIYENPVFEIVLKYAENIVLTKGIVNLKIVKVVASMTSEKDNEFNLVGAKN